MNADGVDFAAAMKPRSQRQKPLPPAKLYDLEPVKKQFLIYTQEIEKMVAEAEALKIKDDDTNIKAVGMGTSAKGLTKKIGIETKRIIEEPEIQRVLQFVKSLKNFVKPFQERLGDIETGLKKKIRDYEYKLELERREAERKAEEERQRFKAILDEEAKARNVPTVEIEPQIVPKTKKPTRTETGSSYQRTDWVFEVKDLGKLIKAAAKDEGLRKFLLADKVSLNQAVSGGIREIPGVEIFEKSSTVFRM